MILFNGQRASDSPFVERVWCSHSEGSHPFLSIAINRLELIMSRIQGKVTMTIRGPETRVTRIGDCPADGEWVGILLKPGVFLPHLSAKSLVDNSVDLETVSNNRFWLDNLKWEFPTYENADIFIERLVREGLLMRDPIIEATLQGQRENLTTRAIQYRFLHSLGITQNMVRQIERARAATFLLQQGVAIPETIAQTGYYDQSHLTKSLKYFIGQTPAQLLPQGQAEQLSFLYKTNPFS